MTSFQRQLNLYGFRRVTKGEDSGSYYHPKFQKGRRDLVSEIKRLPGKSPLGPDDKSKTSILPQFSSENRFNPSEGNIVSILGANDRPITMSKLTMKIAGIHSSDATTLPITHNYTSSSSSSTPMIVPPPRYALASINENAYQFIQAPNDSNRYITPTNNLSSSSSSFFHPTEKIAPIPQLHTVCLTREVEQNPPPLLLRNFSVSSTFDEEYRLPAANEEEIPTPTTSSSLSSTTSPPASSTNGTITNIEVPTRTESSGLGEFASKPQPIVRDESESWVKLGALDQLNDMDPFDIDTVFE